MVYSETYNKGNAMKLKNLKLWMSRTPEPTMTTEEWAQKVLDDIKTPLVTRALREAKS